MIVEDIAKYLESKGIGTFTKDIFGMAMPDKPENCVCVYDGVSSNADIYSPVDSPGIQIIVRDKTSKNASNKAYSIYKLLHGTIQSQQVGATFIYQMFAQGFPESIGRNEKGLWEWSMNLNLNTRRD
jgi:hypothetical protein